MPLPRIHADYATPATRLIPREVILNGGSRATIRLYNTEDEPKRKLLVKSVPLSGDAAEPEWFASKYARQCTGGGLILVVICEDHLIGQRCIGSDGDLPHKSCTLSDLRVHPKSRLNGVGRALFDVTVDIARGCPDDLQRLISLVDQEDIVAQNFHTHMGFRPVKRNDPGYEHLSVIDGHFAMVLEISS